MCKPSQHSRAETETLNTREFAPPPPSGSGPVFLEGPINSFRCHLQVSARALGLRCPRVECENALHLRGFSQLASPELSLPLSRASSLARSPSLSLSRSLSLCQLVLSALIQIIALVARSTKNTPLPLLPCTASVLRCWKHVGRATFLTQATSTASQWSTT